MALDFKKPYSLNEIRKHPKEVLISLLIGLLLTSVGYNITANSRADAKVEKVQKELSQVRIDMEAEQKARIVMYENMIFYKNRSEHIELHNDSLVREKTQPFVNKIFQHVK